MIGSGLIRFITRVVSAIVLLTLSLLATPISVAQAPPAAPGNADGGKVKIEWLGHQFFRLTSPNGVVVVTSPWLANPDGPVPVDSLQRTDFILVPNSHNDDMGNPLEVAAVSGATVIAPGPLGNWLIGQGLKKEQFRRGGVGDMFTLKGIRFKLAPSAHDNTLPNGTDGGPSLSFFITFENGFTVFFNAHSTLVTDLSLYATLYQPDLAIVSLIGDPREFAQVSRLLSTNNPKLRTIIPNHMRPDAPIVAQGKSELEKLGLAQMMFVPELRKAYEY
jgi:L-ascorbate metabolism protein UlaG (beta-lactamase superfamily)